MGEGGKREVYGGVGREEGGGRIQASMLSWTKKARKFQEIQAPGLNRQSLLLNLQDLELSGGDKYIIEQKWACYGVYTQHRSYYCTSYYTIPIANSSIIRVQCK